MTVALYWSPAPGSTRFLPTEDEDGVPLDKRVAETPVTAFVINDEDFENIQAKMN